MPVSLQISIAKQILPLADMLIQDHAALGHLYEMTKAIHDCIDEDDDATVAFDVMEYVHECLEIAKGKEDSGWRQQLRETLQDDLKDED